MGNMRFVSAKLPDKKKKIRTQVKDEIIAKIPKLKPDKKKLRRAVRYSWKRLTTWR